MAAPRLTGLCGSLLRRKVETLTAINDEFTKQAGARADLQVQDWDGITTKITTALADE